MALKSEKDCVESKDGDDKAVSAGSERTPIGNGDVSKANALKESGKGATAAAPTMGRSSETSWMRMYQNLKSYQQKHGNLHVSVEDTAKNQGLCRWVARQRADYLKDPQNGISPNRKKLLDELGFVWALPRKTSSRSKSKPPTEKQTSKPSPHIPLTTENDIQQETRATGTGNYQSVKVEDKTVNSESPQTSKPSPQIPPERDKDKEVPTSTRDPPESEHLENKKAPAKLPQPEKPKTQIPPTSEKEKQEATSNITDIINEAVNATCVKLENAAKATETEANPARPKSTGTAANSKSTETEANPTKPKPTETPANPRSREGVGIPTDSTESLIKSLDTDPPLESRPKSDRIEDTNTDAKSQPLSSMMRASKDRGKMVKFAGVAGSNVNDKTKLVDQSTMNPSAGENNDNLNNKTSDIDPETQQKSDREESERSRKDDQRDTENSEPNKVQDEPQSDVAAVKAKNDNDGDEDKTESSALRDAKTADEPLKGGGGGEETTADGSAAVASMVNVSPEILALNEFLPLKKSSALKNRQWHEGYEKCKLYQAKYGTTFVTRERMNEFDGLYNWTYRQRRLLWEYELSRDRKELLDLIGFDFGAPAIASANMVKEKASAETLQLQKELEEGNYHRKRKRTQVISKDEERKEEPKSKSKRTAKVDYRREDSDEDDDNDDTSSKSHEDTSAKSGDQHLPSPLSKREQPAYVEMWMNKWAELKAYKKNFGTTTIHHGDTKRRGLYHWARRQRLAYKKKELSQDRIKKLDKIGFDWETPKQKAESSDDESSSSSVDTAQQQSNFSKAKSKSKHTTASRAGTKKARSKNTAGSSGDESMSSGGLDKFQLRWLQSFRELKQFQREHGTYEVTYSYKEHRHLYHWIRRQRQRYHENDLPADRKSVLDDFGFEWDPEGKSTGKNLANTQNNSDTSVSRQTQVEGENSDTSGSISDSSSSSSGYAHTRKRRKLQMSIPLGNVEDMEDYLDSLEDQIREKEEELTSLHSVASRVRYLLQNSKASASFADKHG